MISSVCRPIKGIPKPKHKPFATDAPIRSPVYEPGPLLTATASSRSPSPFSAFKQSST